LIFLRISTHSTRLEVAHHLEDPSDADKRIDDTEQSAVGASLVAALRVGCVLAQERGPRIDEAYAVQWCEEQPVSCGSLRMPGMSSRTFDSDELECTEARSGRTAFHLIQQVSWPTNKKDDSPVSATAIGAEALVPDDVALYET
jgi:hypothetical protein